MKKKYFVLLFLLLFVPFVARAEDLTYTEAKEAIQQSIQAWYMRGYYRQYNSSKNTYVDLRHPEDATSQDTGYSVCSGFTNDAWMEAFGFQAGGNDGAGGKTPSGSTNYVLEARSYLDAKGCKTSKPDVTGCKGEYLIYYQNNDTNDNKKYFYNPNGLETSELSKVSNFVKLLQEGDMLSYDGHVVIVYGFKYDSNGKKTDALLFESGGGGIKIMTKIDPTENKLRRLFFYKAKKTDSNGLLDISSAENPYEGTVHWRWLSSYAAFVKDGKINCQKGMCSITRAYYKGSDNKAVLNYDVKWPQNIRASKARIEMPGIYITKTSSKYDNNSVVLGDTITYTITLVNNSALAKEKGESKGAKYTNVHVVESLPAEVEFVSATVDGSPEGTYSIENNTVYWTVSSIAKGEKVVLKYKVKVKKEAKNIGKFFEATGKVYKSNENNYITTGAVRLEIINSTAATEEEYKTCYNQMKKDGFAGLALIQKTYICVYGEEKLDFNLRKFEEDGAMPLTSLIVNPSSTAYNKIRLDITGDKKTYADMILNNYWNGLNYATTSDGSKYYYFPQWRDADTSTYLGGHDRADTIMSGHFKTGDVLIYYENKNNTKESLRYTKENGVYAYIYLEGSFVGVNHESSSAKRNAFTKQYYTDNKLDMSKNLYEGSTSLYDYANYQTLFGKDAYVIFRPEKVITDVSKIVIKTEPTKKTYYQNQTLDLTGGVITATLTDGTTKDVDMKSSDVKVTGYNSTKAGEQTITVTYEGKSASFKVTVVEVVISSISVKSNPTKTTYYVGDKLDVTGGTINIHYSDGSTKSVSMNNKNVTLSGFSSSEAGTKTVTVTYSGKTTTFNVTVNAVELTSIEIEKYPTKVTYTAGEDINLSGGKIKKNYNSGKTELVDMTDSSVTISGYNKDQLGPQTIIATVEGKNARFEVYVNSNSTGDLVMDSISIYKTPDKLNYHIGDTLDITGGKVRIKSIRTVNGASEDVYAVIDMNYTGVAVTGFSSTEVGEKTITVTYLDKSATFTVVVTQKESKISTIEVSKLPTKKKYIQFQEELNVEGGELTATYTDNTTKTVALTDNEVLVLDFDNTQLGEQQIHVIYKGLEASFPVTVYESTDPGDEGEDENGPIESVEIAHNPDKIIYIQNEEELDLSGVILRVTYEDGETRNIDLGDYPGQYTITGFDNTQLGEQTVTVDYHGFQASFKVNIISFDSIEIPDTLSHQSIIITLFSLLLIGAGIYLFYITKNTNTNEQ